MHHLTAVQAVTHCNTAHGLHRPLVHMTHRPPSICCVLYSPQCRQAPVWRGTWAASPPQHQCQHAPSRSLYAAYPQPRQRSSPAERSHPLSVPHAVTCPRKLFPEAPNVLSPVDIGIRLKSTCEHRISRGGKRSITTSEVVRWPITPFLRLLVLMSVSLSLLIAALVNRVRSEC